MTRSMGRDCLSRGEREEKPRDYEKAWDGNFSPSSMKEKSKSEGAPSVPILLIGDDEAEGRYGKTESEFNSEEYKKGRKRKSERDMNMQFVDKDSYFTIKRMLIEMAVYSR